MRRHRPTLNGFTLIEVSIAIVVMAIMASVATAQITGLYAEGTKNQLGSVSASLGSMLTAAADRLDKSACSLTATEQTTLLNALDIPNDVTVTPQGNTQYLIKNTKSGTTQTYTHQSCT